MKFNKKRFNAIRILRNLTQSMLGERAGYASESAGTRISQYESGTRIPQDDTINKFAHILDVPKESLTTKDISCMEEFMQLMFAVEDFRGLALRKNESDGICIRFEDDEINEFLYKWLKKQEELETGEISERKYDLWRYSLKEEDDE